MDAPDLILPLRLDDGKALAQLGKISAAGQTAGQNIAPGGDKAGAGLRRAKGGADTFTRALLDITKAQIGLNTVRQLAVVVGSAFSDTAKYVEDAARQFTALRTTLQEVATLKGQANSTEFTLEEAKKGQKFQLTPQEFRDFQAQFQNYAGSQIGEGRKLTEAQGEEYAGRVAQLMKESGVNPAVGAELAGSLLENAKGPQDVDALMKRLSQTFQVLEKGRVPLERALSQLLRIMSRGVQAEDAAKLCSITSPVAPGEEGTAVMAATRAIQEIKTSGAGEEFGVKKGMGQYESIKAFATNFGERKTVLMQAGKTEQEAENELAVLLKKKGVADDIRDQIGLIGGFARQVVELGGFKTYEEIQTNTPESSEADREKCYHESKEGRAEAIRIMDDVSKAKLGARNEPVEQFRKMAEIKLREGGTFEKPNFAAVAAANVTGASDARTLQINQQVIRRARAMLGEQGAATDTIMATNQGLTDALLRELLKRLESIDDETKKQNAMRVAAGGGKPLEAPAPGGARGPGAGA